MRLRWHVSLVYATQTRVWYAAPQFRSLCMACEMGVGTTGKGRVREIDGRSVRSAVGTCGGCMVVFRLLSSSYLRLLFGRSYFSTNSNI